MKLLIFWIVLTALAFLAAYHLTERLALDLNYQNNVCSGVWSDYRELNPECNLEK